MVGLRARCSSPSRARSPGGGKGKLRRGPRGEKTCARGRPRSALGPVILRAWRRNAQANRERGGWRRRWFHLALLGAPVLWAAAACTADPAGRAAREFVDALYVRLDHPAAEDLSVGLARAKVRRERLLLPATPAAAEERAHVFYRETDRRELKAGVTIEFRLSAVSQRDAPVERRLVVYLRPFGGEWRVFDFEIR